MTKAYVFAVLLFTCLQTVTAQDWTSLATDPEGDGFIPGRPDAKEIFYYYDAGTDSMWFRTDVYGTLATSNWGFNLLVDTDQDQSNGTAWPGPNNAFKFDIGLTVWVTGSPGNYSGTIGVATGGAMFSGNFTELYQNNVTLQVDENTNSYIIGLPRTHLDPDDAKFNCIASIGVSMEVNDDTPNTGNLVIEEEVISSVGEPEAIVFGVYPNPASAYLSVQLPIHIATPETRYVVYDLLGRQRLSGSFSGEANAVRLETLEDGVYILRIHSAGIWGERRFVVRHTP